MRRSRTAGGQGAARRRRPTERDGAAGAGDVGASTGHEPDLAARVVVRLTGVDG